MKQPSPTLNPPDIAEVKKQFNDWRTNRQKRKPIPKHLWEAAVSLSSDYTVNQIARALGLNYTDLKKRINSHPRIQTVLSDPVFFEMDVSGIIPKSQYAVEMENKSGNRMKIHIKSGSMAEIIELSNLFWNNS